MLIQNLLMVVSTTYPGYNTGISGLKQKKEKFKIFIYNNLSSDSTRGRALKSHGLLPQAGS